jgi:hypothetical protein
MNTPIEKRVEALEQKVADLTRFVAADTADKPSKDWRRTFGMSANDPEFDEMIRLGKEYRQAQRAEDEPDANPGH